MKRSVYGRWHLSPLRWSASGQPQTHRCSCLNTTARHRIVGYTHRTRTRRGTHLVVDADLIHRVVDVRRACVRWPSSQTSGPTSSMINCPITPGSLPIAGSRGQVSTCFGSYPRRSNDDVLLCTDLHSENIVLDARRGWVIIDPKPDRGDRHYNLTRHLLNCDRRCSEPVVLVRRVAGLSGCEPSVVQQWAFARCAGGT